MKASRDSKDSNDYLKQGSAADILGIAWGVDIPSAENLNFS